MLQSRKPRRQETDLSRIRAVSEEFRVSEKWLEKKGLPYEINIKVGDLRLPDEWYQP
jgi:hypothetical protein